MDEPDNAQSAPSAAGAPRGLLAMQVRRAAVGFSAWHLPAGRCLRPFRMSGVSWPAAGLMSTPPMTISPPRAWLKQPG